MAGRTKEYIQVTQVTLKNVNAARRAQYEMRRYGLAAVPDEDVLFSRLGQIAEIVGVAGLIFAVPSVVALAGTVCGLAAGMSFSTREALENILLQGQDGLQELEYYFEDNPRVKAVKVKMSYLDYIDDGVRFVQKTSTDYIEEWNIDGKWFR